MADGLNPMICEFVVVNGDDGAQPDFPVRAKENLLVFARSISSKTFMTSS